MPDTAVFGGYASQPLVENGHGVHITMSIVRNDWMPWICQHAVADEANLETEGKRIPFRISSSVMYDARLHCKNKQMLI